MKFRRSLSIFAILLAASIPARAEYRAFRLAIEDKKNGTARTVVTTLDPNQYGAYHYLKSGEVARIEKTWMCRNRSDGFQPICPAPADLEQSPEKKDPSNGVSQPVLK